MSRSGDIPAKSHSSPTLKAEEVRVPDRLFFRIRDVAKLAGVEAYVLRYWESEFPSIAPSKSAAGHRVYRRSDVETILLIKKLLYVERYSIEGARKRLVELKRGKGADAPSAIESAPVLVAEKGSSSDLMAIGEELAEVKAAARRLASWVSENRVSDLFTWG